MLKYLFKMVSDPCELILISSPPQSGMLHQIPVRSNWCYILVKKEGEMPRLYFINKAKNQCDLLDVTLEIINKFDQMFKPCEFSEALYSDKLEKITSLIQHDFKKHKLEEIKIMLEKEGAFNPALRASSIYIATGQRIIIDKLYECIDVLSAIDEDGETLLCRAVRDNNIELSDILIKAGAYANYLGLPLLAAFSNVNEEMVRKLLSAGAALTGEKIEVPPQLIDSDSFYANPLCCYLAFVCKKTSSRNEESGLKLLKLLCDTGVDVNKVLFDTPPAFLIIENEYTSEKFKVEALRILIRSGLAINVRHIQTDETHDSYVSDYSSDNSNKSDEESSSDSDVATHDNHISDNSSDNSNRSDEESSSDNDEEGRTLIYHATCNEISGCIIELIAAGAIVNCDEICFGSLVRLLDSSDDPEVINSVNLGNKVQKIRNELAEIKLDSSREVFDSIGVDIKNKIFKIIKMNNGLELLCKYFDNIYQRIGEHKIDEVQLKFFENCILQIADQLAVLTHGKNFNIQSLYEIIGLHLYQQSDLFAPLALQYAMPLADASRLMVELYRKYMDLSGMVPANTLDSTLDGLAKLHPALFKDTTFTLMLLKITHDNPRWFFEPNCWDKYIAPHLQANKDYTDFSNSRAHFCIGKVLYKLAIYFSEDKKLSQNILQISDEYLQMANHYRTSDLLRWEIQKLLTSTKTVPTFSVSSAVKNINHVDESANNKLHSGGPSTKP